MLVELAACFLAEMRADFANFKAARLGLLHRCFSNMGLTLSGRASLEIPQPAPSNPFAEFDKGWR
jgi:hypothetical protein